MRIAQVVVTFPPYHGGMGYVCHHNALELGRRGHDVTVFTLDHGRLPCGPDPAEYRVERLRTPLLWGDAGVVPQLAWRLRGFDAVHLHYPFFGGAEYVYLASLLARVPYLLTYHMDVYPTSPGKKALIAAYEPLLLRRIVNGAAVITSPGRAFLETTKVGRSVDWSKVIDVGHAGVDTDRFAPREKPRELLERHGLAEGSTVILFVGNLLRFKGLHLLIDAVAGLDDPSAVLVVVGGGYAEAEYRAQVEALGASHRVVFAGAQSADGLLPAYYNLADIFVLPSTHMESFGLVTLEAMASGKPAIVSTLPGPAQLVDEGRDGLHFRNGDAADLRARLECLLRDPALRRELGAAGREKVVGRYTWAKIAEGLEGALRRIVRREG